MMRTRCVSVYVHERAFGQRKEEWREKYETTECSESIEEREDKLNKQCSMKAYG